MGKPSNADLLAERKAIRELLDVPDDVSTLDSVTALKIHSTALKAELRQITDAKDTWRAAVPRALPESLFEPGSVTHTDDIPRTGVDAPIIEKKPPGVPVDTAIYPGFNDHPPIYGDGRVTEYHAGSGLSPEMSPITGDLTPNYCRWLLAEKGPAFMKEKYLQRLHLLPEDVRRALA